MNQDQAPAYRRLLPFVGQLVVVGKNPTPVRLLAVHMAYYVTEQWHTKGEKTYRHDTPCRPVLRQYKGLSAQEKQHMTDTILHINQFPRFNAAATSDYCDAHGIDCRGMIETGEAIDAATLHLTTP